MVEKKFSSQQIVVPQQRKRAGLTYSWMKEWWFLLVGALFVFELFTPFLQWPFGLPKLVTVTVHGATALIIFATFATMLMYDRIPKGVLIILGITLIWSIVSLYEGQSIPAFLWGWYRMFRYPLIGLFVYLTVGNPQGFSKWFVKFCIVLLAFQVLVQVIMYAMGFPINDEMGGTFGWRGVANYIMMVFIIVSVGIGHWMATKELKYLLLSLVLGFVGSILSATKFYLIGVVILLGIALFIQLVWGGKIRQLTMFVALFIILGSVFVPIYNNFLVTELGLPTLQESLQGEELETYLFFVDTSQGSYYFGRGQAILYGWQQIQRDITTTLFGFGLGSRSSSTVLGVSGASLQNDLYGGVQGTSLSIFMQEYGLVGLFLFMLLAIWINMRMFHFARIFKDPHQLSLIYGLILFTSCWPVWVLYTDISAAGVMLILYVVQLGYIFQQASILSRTSIFQSDYKVLPTPSR